MQLTLAGTIVLVMLVVFLFLRRATPTIAAGVTVPLSLAGTCALMWCVGFSIDNLSLMALAVSVGFVVDDAIVMIENVFRNLEKGHSPLRATIEGARQIGFTVISISVSLVAAFIPLLFMGGIVGRVFREFSVTLVFAIVISTIVSLTVTPMICAHYVRSVPSRTATRFDRMVEWVLVAHGARLCGEPARAAGAPRADAGRDGGDHRAHRRSLHQDAEGLLPAGRHRADLHLDARLARHLLSRRWSTCRRARSTSSWPIRRSRASAPRSAARRGARRSTRAACSSASSRSPSATASRPQRVIDRLRPKFARIPGIEVWMFPAQDVRVGGRQGRSQYQFTLWSSDLDELLKWVPRAVERVKAVPGVVDVSTDREQGGFQLNVVDRPAAASRLGVRVQDIDAALANAYAQRQVSTIYTQRNQYRVDPGGRSALSARPERPLAHLRPRHRRRAGSALQRGAVRAQDRAAGRSIIRASSRR